MLLHKKNVFLTMLILTVCLSNCKDKSLNLFNQEVSSYAESGRKMVKVGDKIISEGHFQLLKEVIPGFNTQFQMFDGRKRIVSDVIEQELFVQKAMELGLQNSPRFQRQLWLQSRALLGGEYLYQESIKKAQEKYEKDKEKYYTQVDLGMITLFYGKDRSEKRKNEVQRNALEIRGKLNEKNFSSLAKEFAEDPLEKSNEGKIGFVSKIDQRIKTLEWGALIEKAFSMQVNEISEPLSTKEGVHIIKVLAPKKVQPFQEVSGYIQQEILVGVKQELVQKLKKEKTIEILEPKLLPPETQQAESKPIESAQ